MRSINATDLKMKVFFGWADGETPGAVVSSLNDNQLSLESPISSELFKSLDKLIVSFRVAGKWKSYDLTPVHCVDTSAEDKIDCIPFELPKKTQTQFKRDFALARF
ncbi:MAG: hypothetical protein HN509_01140 [Halobacteriovoraceae bacterium]|jgi:hypothetical protein|nr:hypothetical protein [Halobacteriovoraceae bacterium]MBT5093556.1 hypothetical protein [Halobacteriovoraceae bacterium]